MKRPTIVGTGPLDQVAVDVLKPFGSVVIAPDPSEQTLAPLLADAIGLVVRGGGKATARMIQSAPALRVIGRSGSGYDTVDVAAATERGVAVVFAPGFGARAVAEAAMTFMLALCKKLSFWDAQLKSGNWNSRFESRPGDLDGATLGIIGLGRAGQSLAELARAFRMRLLAYDPYAAPARAASLGVELLALPDLLRQADFVSIHAPLTHETVGLINRDRLSMLKRGAFLINLSRGGLIENLDVLYEAMQTGQLAGVGVDVFDPAPPDPRHPIFALPNCLTSPHALATTERAMHDIFESMARDMAAVLSGTTPRFIVNPEVLDRRASGAS